MSPAERIREMQAAGTLTTAQAEMLVGSLRQSSPEPQPAKLHRGHMVLWVSLSAFISVLLFIFFGPESGEGPNMVQNVEQSMNQPMHTGGGGKLFSALLLFGLVPLLFGAWIYNGLVSKEEAVFATWAQVESTYQRRADLIPGLLQTVTTFMQHEKETLENLTEHRSGEQISMDDLVDEIVRSQSEATVALDAVEGSPPDDERTLAIIAMHQEKIRMLTGKLMAVAESYPTLRAADQFLELQAQLEGTENRINVARMRFNEAAAQFNASIRRTPANLVAALGGFQRKAYFQSDAGASKRPDLNFE